jgi:hypothetical protein
MRKLKMNMRKCGEIEVFNVDGEKKIRERRETVQSKK